MRTPARLVTALVLAALAAVGAPLDAQAAPVPTDTVRGSVFSDRTISEAFGLPETTQAQVAKTREQMRCMQTEDAILCNLAAPDRSANECANMALSGHFIVWFDMLGGQRTDKQVYVAVECGSEVVTMSSRRRFPAFEFTLSSRNNDSVEEKSRAVVFIQTQ
jgi:hypothetical protein